MYFKAISNTNLIRCVLPCPLNTANMKLAISYFGFSHSYANNAIEGRMLLDIYCLETTNQVPLLITGKIDEPWNEPVIGTRIYQTLPDTVLSSLNFDVRNQYGVSINTHTGLACIMIHIEKC